MCLLMKLLTGRTVETGSTTLCAAARCCVPGPGHNTTVVCNEVFLALFAGSKGRRRFAAAPGAQVALPDEYDLSDGEDDAGALATSDANGSVSIEQRSARRATALQEVRRALGSSSKDVLAMLRLLSMELLSPAHVQGFVQSLQGHAGALYWLLSMLRMFHAFVHFVCMARRLLLHGKSLCCLNRRHIGCIWLCRSGVLRRARQSGGQRQPSGC